MGKNVFSPAGDGSWCSLGAARSDSLPLQEAIPLNRRGKENLPRKSFSPVSAFTESPQDSSWPVPFHSFCLQASPSGSFYCDRVPCVRQGLVDTRTKPVMGRAWYCSVVYLKHSSPHGLPGDTSNPLGSAHHLSKSPLGTQQTICPCFGVHEVHPSYLACPWFPSGLLCFSYSICKQACNSCSFSDTHSAWSSGVQRSHGMSNPTCLSCSFLRDVPLFNPTWLLCSRLNNVVTIPTHS